MRRRNVRTLSLMVVTFTYLLIGAAVFDALEGPNNEQAFEALQNVRGQFVSKYNISDEDYRMIELLMVERKSHKTGPQWKFAGSFYYALVTLALIGYGHSTPATDLGKIVTMVYAGIGIPLCMVMFQSMGERMNKLNSIVISLFRRWRGWPRTEATEFELIVASVVMSGFVIHSGALMFHLQEGWSLIDSLYYTFITLSTIGFGDFVALQNESKDLQFNPGYVICSFIFLLIGLAAIASSINQLVLRFMMLSLEEDKEDNDDLIGGGAQNIMTLDGEIMALNGRVLTGQMADATSERDIVRAVADDRASVCSCTCYGRSTARSRAGDDERNGSGGDRDHRTDGGEESGRRPDGSSLSESSRQQPPGRRMLWCLGRTFGCGESVQNLDEENFYDEETQSISNYARYAVKRASF